MNRLKIHNINFKAKLQGVYPVNAGKLLQYIEGRVISLIVKLAIAQMLFNAIFQFSNLFINTYIFIRSSDIRVVAEYNFYLYMFWGISFYYGFKCCEKSTRISFTIAGLASLLGTILLIVEVNHPFWLGLMLGITAGFFWPPYLAVYRALGKISEGSNTFAKASILGSVVVILIPILFGHLVEEKGYLLGFICISLLSIGLIGFGFVLPQRQTKRISLGIHSFHHLRLIFTNALQGFYLSFIGISAGLLVFLSGEGEAEVGTYGTFYGLLTLVINIMMGFFLPKHFNSLGILISSIIYCFSTGLFLTNWDSKIILFNFLMAAAGPLFLNPTTGLNFSYINSVFRNGEEGLFVRECGLSIGRLLFFIYMFIDGLNVQSISFYLFLFTTSLFPFLIYLLTRKWMTSSMKMEVTQSG